MTKMANSTVGYIALLRQLAFYMVGAAIAIAIARYYRITRKLPYILVQKRSKSLGWIKNGSDLHFRPSLILSYKLVSRPCSFSSPWFYRKIIDTIIVDLDELEVFVYLVLDDDRKIGR